MKLFTTVCLVVALASFMYLPVLIARRPSPGTPRAERKAFAMQLEVCITLPMLALIGAGVGSALIMRRARQEYRDQAIANMQILVESATARSEKTKNSDG